jgi:hypothetical protein
MVRGRDDERAHGQQQDRHAVLGGRHLEGRLVALNASGEEGAAEDEEQVREDAAEERGLHDAELALDQGQDADCQKVGNVIFARSDPPMASTALPKVAFRSAPIESLRWMAHCSVHSPSRAASGTMAMNEMMKVAVLPQPAKCETKEKGMEMQRTLM